MNSTTGTVDRLSPFTEYICTIFAFTVLPGPMSDPIAIKTAQQSGITNHSVTVNNTYHDIQLPILQSSTQSLLSTIVQYV